MSDCLNFCYWWIIPLVYGIGLIVLLIFIYSENKYIEEKKEDEEEVNKK